MANLFDYLQEKGNISFADAPFNVIDSLVLTRLSFLPFEDIISESFQGGLSIAEAGAQFFSLENATEKLIMKMDETLLRELAQSERFKDLILCGYVNQIDPLDEKQFAALTICLPLDFNYVSYRGTDGSLAGWKEDLNMSFTSAVPSQLEAAHYLNQAAGKLSGRFILGGHSKGGNLAIYAAAFCEPQVQDRIISVYSFDGPGFPASVLTKPGYQNISAKIKSYVPQSSVVGMLLQHEVNYSVIESRRIGLLQHDLFSWKVVAADFVYLEEVTEGAKFLDQTLKLWIESISPAEREEFVDTLFTILEETEAETLKELTTNWYQNARILLRSFQDLDGEVRDKLAETLRLFFTVARENISLSLSRPRILQELRGKKEEQD